MKPTQSLDLFQQYSNLEKDVESLVKQIKQTTNEQSKIAEELLIRANNKQLPHQGVVNLPNDGAYYYSLEGDYTLTPMDDWNAVELIDSSYQPPKTKTEIETAYDRLDF